MTVEKEKCNFVISGTGRCGTKFLANLMNLSKTWTVIHEPRGFVDDSYEKAFHVFTNHNRYGEISTSLIYDLLKFKMKKGVIIRPYKEVVLSYCNRRTDIAGMISAVIAVNKKHNKVIDLSKRKDIEVIHFRRMTKDLKYLNAKIALMGIPDLVITEKDIAPVNENKTIKFKRYAEIPRIIQHCVNGLVWK